MSHLEVHAHLKVRPGQLEGFRRQAAELIRITREQDMKTDSSSTTRTCWRRERFCSETSRSTTA
jgi:hypothetical protein